jgi:hypothetical protein
MGAARRIRESLREPLLQFLLAGLILFLVHAWWSPRPSSVIVVTPEMRKALEADREALLQRPLSAEEREELLSDFIDDEILLREAYHRGLDRNDPQIRSWLIDRMKFVLDEEPPEPTRADLEAFFREQPERYLTPLAVSFDHVFFASGTEIDVAAEVLLGRLRAGADFHRWGDEFWLGRSLHRFGKLELTAMLGQDFTDRVFALAPGEWSEPLVSSRGIHFVRVLEKHDPEQPTLDDVLWTVREDWLRARREESRARKLTEIRTRYRIEK